MGNTKEKKLQWHPAFFAGLQIELEQDAWNLEFENEHQLGTKPMSIDVLVIKKKTEVPVQKNIGRIFRKYNILEYKSPTDYLSVDDFYKVYGYTCFYKAEAQETDKRKIEDLTITFAVSHYPRSVLRHLKEKRGLEIENKGTGIYYIRGDMIPIQILIVPELSEEENLWLKSLTNQIHDVNEAEHLIEEYGKHKNRNLYQSVMDVIVHANQEKFEEVKVMSDALRELWKDAFDAEVKKEAKIVAQKEVQEKMQKEVQKEVQKAVRKEVQKERDRVNELYRRLAAEANMDDIIRAANDREYQMKLFVKYGL